MEYWNDGANRPCGVRDTRGSSGVPPIGEDLRFTAHDQNPPNWLFAIRYSVVTLV